MTLPLIQPRGEAPRTSLDLESGPQSGFQWKDYLVLCGLLLAVLVAFTAFTTLVPRALSYSSIVFLGLGLRRPAFIVGGIAIMELTIQNYEWGFLGSLVTGRYGPILFGLAVALAAAPLMKQRLTLGSGALIVIIPGAAFVMLATLATSMGVRPWATVEAGRFFGAGLILATLIPFLIDDKNDLKMVGKVVIAVFLFSGIAAALQGIPDLPYFTIGPDPDDYSDRAIALTHSPVQAANVLVVGFLASFAMMTALRLNNFWGVAFTFAVVVLGVGWFYTFTRSALFGTAAGVVVIIPMLRGRVRLEVLAGVIIFGGLLGALILGMGGRFTETAAEDQSAASRIILWKVGLAAAKDNMLFGTGYGSFTLIAHRYLPEVDVSDQDAWLDITEVLANEVHNDFLRVWQEFGIIALIVYILLLLAIVVNALRAFFRAKDDPWMRGISMAVLAALVGYAVNSFFHNYLHVSYMLWALAGFSIALVKVTANHERLESPEYRSPITADVEGPVSD